MRRKVEREEVYSNEAAMLAASSAAGRPPDQKEIVGSPGRRLTVGDVALISELGFLRRSWRAKPGSGSVWYSEVIAGMHNNDQLLHCCTMRRGGELPSDGVRE
jgi:hypothetical protein